MSLKLRDLPDEEYFTSGHTACPGCGAAILARIAMKVFGPNTVVYMPACCLQIFAETYPLNSFRVPTMHLLFENSAVAAAGVSRALKRLGKGEVRVLAIAGDGGTADIGLQALSGAAERNEDVAYICYDNEAYMNTGIQRSGTTPLGAWTTTTPVGKKAAGKEEFKKDMPRIMIAHDIPYVATASLAYPNDLLPKLEKMRDIRGFRYMHALAPCPVGWRFDSGDTVKLSKLAVDSGVFPLYEYENGKLKINREPRTIDVREYVALQGRFKHLTEEDLEKFRGEVEAMWRILRGLARVYA